MVFLGGVTLIILAEGGVLYGNRICFLREINVSDLSFSHFPLSCGCGHRRRNGDLTTVGRVTRVWV